MTWLPHQMAQVAAQIRCGEVVAISKVEAAIVPDSSARRHTTPVVVAVAATLEW